MKKHIVILKQKPNPVRVEYWNNTEESDDWMKVLPGYKDEIKIHEELVNIHNKVMP